MITARRIKMITVISGDSSMTSSGLTAAEKKKKTTKSKNSLNSKPLNHPIHQKLSQTKSHNGPWLNWTRISSKFCFTLAGNTRKATWSNSMYVSRVFPRTAVRVRMSVDVYRAKSVSQFSPRITLRQCNSWRKLTDRLRPVNFYWHSYSWWMSPNRHAKQCPQRLRLIVVLHMVNMN